MTDLPYYTEGVCGDGAAILRDGVMMPIEDIVSELNRLTALAQPVPPAAGEVTELVAELPRRPECFEFALDFLGEPENDKLRAYVEQLEALAALAQRHPAPRAVAWCNSGDFLAASAKRQSFNCWREQHSWHDMALCIAPPHATTLPLPAGEVEP